MARCWNAMGAHPTAGKAEMGRASSFFSGANGSMVVAGRKRAMTGRRDAEPLRPDELVAVRRFLRKPVLEECLPAFKVAKLLSMKPETVLGWCKAGRHFPRAFKAARNAWRIPISDVLAWQERQRVQTPALEASEAGRARS